MAKIKISKCKISILNEGNNIIIDPDVMDAIVVDYFSKLVYFAGTSQEASIIEDVIPTLVGSNTNIILTLLPINEEISNKICRSTQAALVFKVAAIFLLNQIWMARNDIKYNNRRISIIDSINMINTQVKISGDNTSKNSFIFVEDFTTLKDFSVTIRPPKATNIKEVLWSPPNLEWTKCNCDGVFNVFSNTPVLVECLEPLGGFRFRFRRDNATKFFLFLLKLQPSSSVWIMRFRRIKISFRLKWIAPWSSKPIPTLF
ncbi:hypothetical protein KIW84_058070 [Lathyrus oleraceus]|uniref:Uncharacterized protein n=1 Tax=Pisum sativum TaxID=3888 RepID=A0A9D5ALX6_PEA|nr:hypothetical protein KIW84_058070 [Pisum sativum]